MKTASQIDGDCCDGDDGDIDNGGFDVLLKMNFERPGLHEKPMPQLLDPGVLRVTNVVRLARTPSPSRRHILNHRGWCCSWEGGICVALCAKVLDLMMRMMLHHVDHAS